MPKRSSGSAKIFYPEYDREKVLEIIRNSLPQLLKVLPVKLVVLFGSYAKGNFTAFSDIDLLVVYDDPIKEDAYKIVKRTIKLRGLEPHVYSLSEYKQIEKTVEKMIENGVVVYRKEDI
ncbi:nucleotidyltransferase domain-containing protein [Thermotoga sp. 38H-to]|uniref:nucleotidyltransferase domain-containing protein n=1 Tax=Thermotoga sp. 38H-to TaxID=1755812 RepID=UPI0013EC4FDB|nr:nucleotidyltransferase domain-containing protein [Thermotoga sp. 38H-to]KAF2959889.1 DNA polymerase [Thermotoga sp. 38H-to]